MKVSLLIAELKLYPGDLEVAVSHIRNQNYLAQGTKLVNEGDRIYVAVCADLSEA